MRNRHLDDDEALFKTPSQDEQGFAPFDESLCARAVERMRADQVDIASTLREFGGSPDAPSWTDETFTFPDAVHWENLPGEFDYFDQLEYIEWSRIKNKFGSDSYSMWGREQIRPEDAIQGQIGNCWLISAAMSIAESE
jgi:hypothetical protein